ncbi:AsmA family protein [Agrobacterium sp. a22-2]|nr:AsmA-like C-terminal region-containing protein [Agrobacterium sp. a22-2]NKN36252.1 AsmA family protein [Agrobacterium sp. a22-2]
MVFCGGLLVLVLFAALLAPLFITWTDFRKDFEDQASRIIGKKVTVHGAVEARILPFPSVTFSDVTVGQDEQGRPLVRADRFSMDAELAPFLSGEARIFDMRLEGPKVQLRLLADGTLDWLRNGHSAIPARTVVLENIHVTDGVIELVDEQAGRTRVVRGLNADMSARSLAGPWTVNGRAELDGQAGAFALSSLLPNAETGAVPVRLRLDPDHHPVQFDLDGDLAIAEGRPTYKGKFQAELQAEPADKNAGEKPAPEPRAKGSFELANDRIRIPDYRLELGGLDNPYAVTGEATLDTGRAPEFLLTAEGQQIDVNSINVEAPPTGKTGRRAASSVQQRINALVAMAADIPIPTVAGRASLSLPAIVVGDTVIRDIKLDLRPAGTGWTVDRAVALLPGRTHAEVSGKLNLQGEPSFNGDMLVASTQPSGLASWLTGEVDPTIRQMKSAGFSAAVNLTTQLQRFEKLELSVGPARLLGRVERQSFDGKRPNLSIDLAGNAFDFDAMRALATLVAGEQSDDRMLDHLIAAKIKVDDFSAFGVNAHGVDAIFTFADGGFSLQRLNVGDLAGATVQASGEAEGSLLDYSGKATVTLRAADPTAFLAMLQQKLPPHPVLDRMVANAEWYIDTDLTLSAAFGEAEAGGLKIKADGRSNGSHVAIDYSRDSLLDLMGDATVAINAKLDNPEPSVLLGQLGLRPLPIPVGGAAQASLELKQTGTEQADADLRLSADRTALTATGKVDLSAASFLQGSGHVTLESADIEPYLIMNAIVPPQTGSGLPVRLAADVSAKGERLDINGLTGTIASNAVAGTLNLDQSGAVPRIGGVLELDHTDLSWLAETVLGSVSDPLSGDLSSEPIAGMVPGSVDAAIALRAKAFDPGVFGPVTGFSANLSLQDGTLALEDIKGGWLGGSAAGRLMLSNGEGTAFSQMRLDLTGGDLEAVLSGPAGHPAAKGKFDLTLVSETSGKSAADLLSSANGSGELRVSGLTVPALNLNLFAAVLKGADAIEGEIGVDAVSAIVTPLVGQGEAVLGALVVPFTVTDGVVRAQNVAVATQAAQLLGEGRIDLTERQLSAAIGISLNAGDEVLDGAEPAFRMLYEGDLAGPDRSLDVADLTNYLSLRAFERERRRVETMQSNVLEKQRLRREVALYRFQATERQVAREKAEAEERLRREEAEKARLAAEEAAARQEVERRAAEAARAVDPPVVPPADAPAAANPVPVPNTDTVERGANLPPAGLRFDSLPGVN